MNLALAVTLIILLHTGVAGARIALSLFAIKLQATPFTIGVLVSLMALLPMIFSVRTGRLLDRIGVYRPMLAATITVTGSILLTVLLPRLETLFVMSLLLGSGFMLFHISVHHVVGMTGTPDKRVRNFSLIAIAFAISSFTGPMMAGFLIDGIGHRWTFLVMALISASSVVLILVRKFELPMQSTPARARGRRRGADLWSEPKLRRVFVASAVLSMTWDLFAFVMPIHGSNIGLSASKIGIILGVFGVATLIVRVLMPLIARGVREWTMLLGAMTLSAAMFIVIPLAENVTVLTIAAFALGLGLGAAQPNIMSLLYALAPVGRGGEAVGIRSLLLTGSQTSIPLLFGALGSALGMAPAFWLMAGCLGGAAWYARKPAS